MKYLSMYPTLDAELSIPTIQQADGKPSPAVQMAVRHFGQMSWSSCTSRRLFALAISGQFEIIPQLPNNATSRFFAVWAA